MTSTEAPFPPGIPKGEYAPPLAPQLSPFDPAKLNVGLFPYVPMQSWFQAEIKEAWDDHRNPHRYNLNFVYYDYYDPEQSVVLPDVFAFDAIFTEDLKAKKYLSPLPWKKKALETFFPWTTSGLCDDVGNVLALPYLGCTSILVYRKKDTKLNNLKPTDLTVHKLLEVMGPSKDEYDIPPDGKGLLVDLTSPTTLLILYIESIMQHAGEVADPAKIPTPSSELDTKAIDSLRAIVTIAGSKQATYVDRTGYTRLMMFLKGYGQAYVGYPEHFYFFSPKDVEQYGFYPLPRDLEKSVDKIPMYTDAVGVSANIFEEEKKNEAIRLVKIISDKAVNAFFRQDPNNGNPQFLTPVRKETLDQLAGKWPDFYPKVRQLVDSPKPKALRLEANSRKKIKDITTDLLRAVFGHQFADTFEEPDLGPEYAWTPGGLWRRP